MKRIIRYLVSRLFDYGDMSVDISIHSERNWVKFVNKFKPKITIIGEGKTSSESFYTGETYISGCLVCAYGPHFKNDNFDRDAALDRETDTSLASSLLCAYKNNAVTVDEDKMEKIDKCDMGTPSNVLDYYKKIRGE